MVSSAQISAELFSSSLVVLKIETITNKKLFMISEIAETSRQLIETRDSGVASISKNRGSIKNRNQITKAALRPARKPFLFPWGQ